MDGVTPSIGGSPITVSSLMARSWRRSGVYAMGSGQVSLLQEFLFASRDGVSRLGLPVARPHGQGEAASRCCEHQRYIEEARPAIPTIEASDRRSAASVRRWSLELAAGAGQESRRGSRTRAHATSVTRSCLARRSRLDHGPGHRPERERTCTLMRRPFGGFKNQALDFLDETSLPLGGWKLFKYVIV